MRFFVRAYKAEDIPAMVDIWNEVVDEGIAFPQEEGLNEQTAQSFFARQTYCAVVQETDSKEILGMYILHPNNEGRCKHICNTSYAVKASKRGLHVGEMLVIDSTNQAKCLGFLVMQFNAVVASNASARHLYERLGFMPLGVVPRGFRMKDGHFEDICLYYKSLR